MNRKIALIFVLSLSTLFGQKPEGTGGPGGGGGGGHTQNTDTGTTQTSFQIDSTNNGFRIKNSSGALTIRNAADNADANLDMNTGLIDGGSGRWIPPFVAIGSLPAAGVSNTLVYVVTGVAGPGLCSGAGSYVAVCRSDGTAWRFEANVGPDLGTWADGQLGVSSGTSGRGLKPFTGTGALMVTAGVPALVAGSATDCVLVDGTSAACGGGGGGTTYMTAGVIASRPVTCTPGGTNAFYLATDQTSGDNLHVCTDTNEWTKQSYDIGATGALVKTCAGGGVTCTYDIDPNVVPTMNAGTAVYTNAQDFSGASMTAMLRLDTSDAPTCDNTVGEMYFNTVTIKARVCSALNTWSDLAPAPTTDLDWNNLYSLPVGTTFVVTINPASVANTVNYLKFTVPVGTTIYRFQFWHHTNGAGGSTGAVGIYSHAGNLMAQSGAITTASGAATVKAATLGSPVYLAPGSYYWAWSCSDTAARWGGFAVSTMSSVYTPTSGSTADTTNYGTAANAYDVSTGLPATLGSLSNSTSTLSVPLIAALGQDN